MLSIVNVPNQILRQKSKAVDPTDPKLNPFIESLAQTLIHHEDPPGVGLSAVQVGKPIRLFLTYLPNDPQLPLKKWNSKKLKITSYLNPTITATSEARILGDDPDKPFLEGCLSIPRLYGPVPRYQWVEIEYQTFNRRGELITETARHQNFAARVIQHEFDHLEGILFTDYTKQEKSSLYFDDGEELRPVIEPDKLIKW
jgi:peptide deformylase